MGGRADRVLGVAIPQHNVGVTADSQRAFLRVETKEFGRIGGGDGDKMARRQATAAHAPFPEHVEPIFNPRYAIGNFGKAL